ncbi:calpain-5-like [Corythoichthys intestinalis]|uniref:calpain-5-like n=1 Tax=Corythoichthys intestinalis TaxID=161448 RepID=UPI0025A50FFC|nr:calpain-5-like [Corythoichthys intestinalis]XP_057676502.1 calpain-5-like [Corythoichthys intestinalis]XP_057676503.1 calpain-5-like [Corythoichthys intestinalis]XP_061801441.1 calpain-5-like [Nerophis lumbriciformis]
MFSSATPYKNQHYSDLKKDCLRSKKLFEDPEFPCTDASLYFRRPPPGRVQWKRPGEISNDPHLFVEGVSSHDLNQGSVGNCWFVAACSCLALKPNLWKKVIPDWKEQEWNSKHPEDYAGIFHFQFWIFGEWVDVVVDDRLPTINGELIYCHSKDNNEYWSALLEKAYAKLSGCYESLEGGNTGDAVVDFSGAVAEAINLEAEAYYKDQEKLDHLFADLLKVYDRGGIISCSIKAQPHEIELKMGNGLVKGHAYSVTAVNRVRLGHGLIAYFKNETIPMIRMRNPWGKTEWNGPWSDSSEEWSKVGDTERGNLGITVEDDGEFWMSFTDWCKHFTDADVCRLINTSVISIHKTWHEVVHFGSWTKQAEPLLNRCGGCANHKSTFLQNPQYIFDVTKESDEVLISLQQRDMKIHRKFGQGENLTIGFSVFKVELNRKYRLHDILTQKCVATSTYINARTVFMRCTLQQGRYILLPTTFKPLILGDYMVRLFTDLDSNCRELSEDKPKVRCWSSFLGYPQVVTHIYIHAAEGLQNQDSTGGADPYVIISSEGHSVKSPIQKDTLTPEFETSGVFYRKKPRKPLTVQIWNSNAVQDQFMGQVVLSGSPKDTTDPQRLRLRKQGRNMADEMPGSISLRIVTSTQLTAI